MPRAIAALTLATMLGAAALPVAARAASEDAPPPAAADYVLPLQLAQYYAPPPPPPRYRHPHRRCWTESRRVVHYDRWGRPYVRWVPRRVCVYR